MKPQVIATGISGLVGSRIVELTQKSFEFINFSLDNGIDITNFEVLEQKFKENNNAKLVLHLAAFTDVNKAFEQNEDKNGSCYKVNVIGSKNIAQLCKKYGKYLIAISTDFVFDGENPPICGYTEREKTNPIEWYGKTKLFSEQKIQKITENYSILRIAFPYKAKLASKKLEPLVKLDLIRNIINKLKNNEEITMFSDQIITPTFIDDIVKVVNYCLVNKPKGIYHCVGSTSLSPYDLACKVAQTFNLNKNLIKKSSLKEFIKNNPHARPRQKKMILSNEKIKKYFGISLLSIDEGLKKIKKQIT